MPDPTPPPPAPPAAPRRGVGCLLPLVSAALVLSLLLNALLGYLLQHDLREALQPDTALRESYYLGDPAADDRVAVIRIEGVISELTTGYPVRQMEAAARDPRVKAVVLRVNSPGGTVGASDELYQCLVNLRDNTGRRFPGTGPKPLSVSMGAVAASGGYYVAAAGRPIAAERTTITGSIGVFAALPNVAKLAADNGVKVELVKAGGIKASGSFFHDLAADERQTWQDVVDNAYDTFLGVVAAGRPALTPDRLRSEVVIDRVIAQRDARGNPKLDAAGQPLTAKYTRVRADGGTFTAAQAVQVGLVDRVDDLPGAVRAAATAANLTAYKAVMYDRPPGLIDYVIPGGLQAGPGRLDLARLPDGLTPRLWYLCPSADAALLTPDR